jgi:hypothetical protein
MPCSRKHFRSTDPHEWQATAELLRLWRAGEVTMKWRPVDRTLVVRAAGGEGWRSSCVCAPVAATITKGTMNYEAEPMRSTPDHQSSAPYLDTADLDTNQAQHLSLCQKVAESAVLDFAAWLSQSH